MMLENTDTVTTADTYQPLPMSLSSMAMLVELRISTWTARKRDNETTMEINTSKEADQDSGSVYKYLMAGSDHLKKIEKYSAKCRAWNGTQTLPWMKGIGLLPMENFFKYREQLATMEANFFALVDDFIAEYPRLKNDQAFKLGKWYKADEFPDIETLPRRFKFEYNFLPVPESGDFRINCEARIKADLQEQYEKMFDNKLADAMRDPWDRLHKVLTHMTDKLTDNEDGDRKIFRDSIIDNAVELCDLLTRLNVVKDPELEKARRMLEKAVTSTDVKDLRTLSSARLELKTDVQDILNKFKW
jgi:hypothetical protein